MNQNSLSAQLGEVNRLHENGLKIFNAFLEAVTTQNQEISVDIENQDGSTTTVTIPSNIFLGNQIEILRESFLNITGLSESSFNTLISLDDQSSFREIFINNYKRTYDPLTISNISVEQQAIFSDNPIFENLLSPLTEISIQLSSDFLTSQKVKITKFKLNNPEDIDAFSSGQTYSQVLTLLEGLNYQTINDTIQVEPRENRFSGDFHVISKTEEDDGSFTLVLDDLNFNDSLSPVDGSRELSTGDILITGDGNSRLQVNSVNTRTNTINLSYQGGYSQIEIGENSLEILSVENNPTTTLKIPISFNEKSIIFFQPVDPNTGIASPVGESFVLDADNYSINTGSEILSFNEWFNLNVVNIGNFFKNFVQQSSLPNVLGNVPDKPLLQSSYFSVVPINEHLTNTADKAKLKKLQIEKRQLFSDIEKLTRKISDLNLRISRGNYTTNQEKRNDIAELNGAIQEKNSKTALYKSTVEDISTNLSEINISGGVNTKYRIRGFWPIQENLTGIDGTPQKIIQYQVSYRYLGNNIDTVRTQNLTFNDGEDDVSGNFSSWNTYYTDYLKKVRDENGNLVWENNNVEDSNQNNINQLDIPIRYGESVEIQIKAITEAGYPIAPVTSPFSDIIRVEFPEELLIDDDIKSISLQNEEDLLQVQIQQEFDSQGITEHIDTAFTQQDRYFAHDARQIASGFLTDEQTIISLFEKLVNMQNQITALEEQVVRRVKNITIEIIDPSNRSYIVNNTSTLKLFSGFYINDVNLSNSEEFGSIVEKIFFLKIVNNNSTSVDITSNSPGSLELFTGLQEYNDIPISLLSSQDPEKQYNGQIFYLRRNSINGIGLYNDLTQTIETSDLEITTENIDIGANEALKDIVHYPGGNPELVKLFQSAILEQTVALSRLHPLYQEWENDPSNASKRDALDQEFNRIKEFNQYIGINNIQNSFNQERNVEFNQFDRYLVGKNTLGSKLFIRLNDISGIQTQGSDPSSIKTILPGEENALLVPIVFQYRMTDILGRVNGDPNLTFNTNLEYRKKLGFDFFINNQPFKFDLEITSRFRPNNVGGDNQGISNLSGSIDTNSSTVPNIL